ncbi:MAG: hypothetical protein M1834_007876 [Cirrosporium novae-zelandiae]|nr:MAG: hypothetical protein M1834_007876 [Cirrosporium novae-zelandiae]
MVGRSSSSPRPLPQLVDRATICLASDQPGITLHKGDDGFGEKLARHFPADESSALEQLITLKAKLKGAEAEEFWKLLMEGMTTITSAQYGFVAKRILVDNQNAAVEMPPIGQEGSCLMGVAFYYNDGGEIKDMHRDYKYLAWGCPCAHMRHDKTFLIPEKLNSFIMDNPNKLPIAGEAYLGVPLFSEGKCLSHFGIMWGAKGLEQLTFGWGFLEMMLHSLEDLILERLVQGQGFARPTSLVKSPYVIPQEAVTTLQTIKPYARSLYHELRTPMQGIVGMLSVLQATVQHFHEKVKDSPDTYLREVAETFREGLEAMEDSSRRVVEAADNVVHACDLGMQIPDTPDGMKDDESTEGYFPSSLGNKRQNILLEGKQPIDNPHKRRRSSSGERSIRPPFKHRAIQSSLQSTGSHHHEVLRSIVRDSHGPKVSLRRKSEERSTPAKPTERPVIAERSSSYITEPSSSRGADYTNLRNLLPIIVHEALMVGGRPDSVDPRDTPLGQSIKVRSKGKNGQAFDKIIEWSVDPSVPITFSIDEDALTRIIDRIFRNAVKFTEGGTIILSARKSSQAENIIITIKDTGAGISDSLRPKLFNSIIQGDISITRSKEGLGLGLMVAKRLARKLGGDLKLLHSEIHGPNHGSVFEARVPILPPDSSSTRSNSPGPPETSLSGPKLYSTTKFSPQSRISIFSDEKYNTRSIFAPSNIASATSIHPHPTTSLTIRQPSPVSRTNPTSALNPTDTTLASKYPLTFLIAEDDYLLRRILSQMLKSLGYAHMYEAFNGTEAVAQMEKSFLPGQRTIDVVLMDLWMPEMDGYDATTEVLEIARREGKSVTVLAVSADATLEAMNKAREKGAKGFLTKPYNKEALRDFIVRFHEEKERQATATAIAVEPEPP